MGEVATEIHRMVKSFCDGELEESEFSSKLNEVEQRHQNPGNIGRAIEKGLRLVNADESQKTRVWQLAESTDPDIKGNYDEWSDASNWDI